VSPRRPATPAFQLPLLPAAEVNPASGTCQRWSGGTHRWRRRRDGGFDRSRYRAARIDNAVAKRVVEREHYLHTFPAARLSWGLYEGHQLLGVAVFGVPSHPAVVRNVFPDLQPYHESLVLSRFVLVDAVPANGESERSRIRCNPRGVHGSSAKGRRVHGTRWEADGTTAGRNCGQT
jgi:hypothetical protein